MTKEREFSTPFLPPVCLYALWCVFISFKSNTLTLALTCPSLYNTDYRRYVYAKEENYCFFRVCVQEHNTHKKNKVFTVVCIAVKWPNREEKVILPAFRKCFEQ